MPRPIRSILPALLTLVAVGAAGCDAGDTGPGSGDGTRTIELGTAGDQFAFDRTSIEVAPETEVTVRFHNGADRESLKHNFVQLDTDLRARALEVAKAGWRAPDEEYVPRESSVLAATGLADPGETVEVTFETPAAPGGYLYICTYPGHYPSMRGTLQVQPPAPD